jgi:hypothetical protein
MPTRPPNWRPTLLYLVLTVRTREQNAGLASPGANDNPSLRAAIIRQ